MENNASYFIGCDKSLPRCKNRAFRRSLLTGLRPFVPARASRPPSMRTDSWGLETYSPYQDKDLIGDLQ